MAFGKNLYLPAFKVNFQCQESFESFKNIILGTHFSYWHFSVTLTLWIGTLFSNIMLPNSDFFKAVYGDWNFNSIFVTNWLHYEKFLSNKSDLMKDLLFFAFLNWFKVVVGPFGQSNMHRRLDFCPDQPGRNRMYQS